MQPSSSPTYLLTSQDSLTTLQPMRQIPQSVPAQHRLVSFFWSGDAIRSRSVSEVVLCGTLDVPAPPVRLVADWQWDIALRLGLVPGDVEALSLPRARMRWPDYRHCVQAASNWTALHAMPDLLADCEVALMACRGASYHHDGARYGGAAFCNLFLSEDKGLDLHFPCIGRRIPLTRGTAVIFDTGQPHAVIARGSSGFDAADFPAERDCTQVFLTWELPVENVGIRRALEIEFDVDAAASVVLNEEQVWVNGARGEVCPDSGRWCPAD